MPDDIFGELTPAAERPVRKRAFQEEDQRHPLQRIQDVLDSPDVFELAESIPPGPGGGNKPDYPMLVHLMNAALLPVASSKRAAANWLRAPGVWDALRRSVRRNESRVAANLLPDEPPNRHHYMWAEKKYLGPVVDELSELFTKLALKQALSQGLLPEVGSRNWADPGRHQLVVGDGTVAKSPSKSELATYVDAKTGREVRGYVDPAARVYKENGEKAAQYVRGAKFFFGSARDDGYFRRVIVNFAHVPGGEYQDEAAVAVRQFIELRKMAPGMMGVVYDGAMRGIHRDALARAGLLIVNRQHESVTPRHLEVLRFARCKHDLWASGGRVAERVSLDDGMTVFQPLPVRKLEAREGAARWRWYHVLDIPCRYEHDAYRIPVAITSTPEDRAVAGRKSDREIGFHRAEYLQQIPQDTAVHERVYGYRVDAESLNAQLDASTWNRRMISYGVERQKVFMLGFALSQNATSRAVHLEQEWPQIA